ncbi:hypothetical protein CFC21_000290 [Triticum aestivum]|uniref:DUF6598 domain-containing protein n=1 Tax=Triticum aestivum TaxID=4565 RepID=A0A3B5XTI5_WHEAT|nr:hypothetical protein CFC21_000290 [Triticum aestivum]
MANEVCMRSPFDLIQSCERFQKRGHGFAEEGTSKKKLATSPSPSSMAGGQASLSSSDLMLSCEGFQKHGYEFPTTHVSHRLLYTTGAESCLSDNGNATAAKDSLSNNLDLKNDDSLGNIPCYDDFLPLEDDSGDTLTHDDAIGIIQRVSPMEYIKRLLLKRSALSISSAELGVNTKLSMIPESSRDFRHSGDLCWHEYYHMSEVSQTVLPPKRYTQCEPLTAVRCFHEPQAMLQVFSIKLKAYLQAIGSSVDVYGFVAVRDGEDYHRNYLFNRPRTDPVTINTTSDYLPLMSPIRGMSMTFECLIEVDIRIKGDIEDVTLVDGCSDLIESHCLYDTEIECTMDDTNGAAMFDFIIFRRALEATIELNFTKVPTGGMEVKMCGYTAISKSLYDFMGEQRECDRFVTSAGKHPQYFIAAVPFEDTLFVDFMEGKLSIPFKAAVHGSQEREYHLSNGAVVSVTVSWSSTYY